MGTVRAIDRFGDELEADFLEFFGIDLLDLWRGRLSLRRVAVLIKALGLKNGRSNFVAAVDESTTWSTTDHLLARVSDALELSNFMFIKANSDGSNNLDPPSPIPRPGAPAAPAPPQEFASGAEVSEFFARMNSL
ncbi:hypothetical protein [Embleya hyalina]|uniref:Uncharacterized protein n=1 Tax=Embleya hyalina TaxID=516124 RepID=A0A401YZ51_9ACTN|nr:hypothetical protein [Embleya hyalina]GCD99863.1 hypothetical protein EHYA_07585 [Embleya hyalina]